MVGCTLEFGVVIVGVMVVVVGLIVAEVWVLVAGEVAGCSVREGRLALSSGTSVSGFGLRVEEGPGIWMRGVKVGGRWSEINKFTPAFVL